MSTNLQTSAATEPTTAPVDAGDAPEAAGIALTELAAAKGREIREMEGIETAFKNSMNRAKVDVAAYFRTLSNLEDFISLRPDAVLGYYTESDAFIRSCESDVLKLRDTRDDATQPAVKMNISPWQLMSLNAEMHKP